MSESDECAFYPRDHLMQTVELVLDGDYDPEAQGFKSKRERLVHVIDTIQREAYGRGKRSVQQGLIKLLDLRHLIGPL